MFDTIGNLAKYWHVIALAHEIPCGSSLRRNLYGYPLLVWRDESDQLHALHDCCAHKKSPLDIADFCSNRVICPYHGWEYDESGKLERVPSDHRACEKLKVSLPRFETRESNGFVWVLPDSSAAKHDVPSIDEYSTNEWGAKFLSKAFDTTDELLIDNFMDPTHTGTVHDGLIRSGDQIADHSMEITTHEQGVHVQFEEREESVGPGMSLFFGKSTQVKHSDEFLLPNLVRVIYEINGSPRFVAFIACTPIGKIDEGNVRAFVQLRYRFGAVGNFVAAPFLGWFASKVLKQDFDITKRQFDNMKACPDQRCHLVASDAVASKVSRMRNAVIAREELSGFGVQKLNLRF